MIDSTLDSSEEGMASGVCYVSLAIYSKHDMEEEITALLGTSPTRVVEKNQIYSWIYSTQDPSAFDGVEHHVKVLQAKLVARTDELARLARDGCDIRVWVYFESKDVNQGFVLQDDFVSWISSFGADIYVDVWTDHF